MPFSINHPIIFVMVALIICVVLAQSVYFLVRAYRRAHEKGMDMAVVKKTIISSTIFTIAPAISILIGIISLSVSLGVPLPWLRLSVIGSLSYETIAARNAIAPFGMDFSQPITDASIYVSVVWVMTLSIIMGLILAPLLTRKIQGGMASLEKRDKKWLEIFNNSMFIGMISAFVGFVFCDVYRLWSSNNGVFTKMETDAITGEKVAVNYTNTSGLVPVFVMLVSAVSMAICGILIKKLKWTWLNDYALPICMILGMACAIPLTNWLGGVIA